MEDYLTILIDMLNKADYELERTFLLYDVTDDKKYWLEHIKESATADALFEELKRYCDRHNRLWVEDLKKDKIIINGKCYEFDYFKAYILR